MAEVEQEAGCADPAQPAKTKMTSSRDRARHAAASEPVPPAPPSPPTSTPSAAASSGEWSDDEVVQGAARGVGDSDGLVGGFCRVR